MVAFWIPALFIVIRDTFPLRRPGVILPRGRDQTPWKAWNSYVSETNHLHGFWTRLWKFPHLTPALSILHPGEESTFPCSCLVSCLLPALSTNHGWRHSECPFQVGELLEEHSESPRRLYFPLSPSSSSRAYLQLPALPPACVWEPACHGLAASKRGGRERRPGQQERLPRRVPHCPGPQSGGCRDFPSFPAGRLRGRAISSCEARAERRQRPLGPQETAPALSERGKAGARRGDSGQKKIKTPTFCLMAATPTRARKTKAGCLLKKKNK